MIKRRVHRDGSVTLISTQKLPVGTTVEQAVLQADLQSQDQKVLLQIRSARDNQTSERTLRKSYKRYNSMEALKLHQDFSNSPRKNRR